MSTACRRTCAGRNRAARRLGAVVGVLVLLLSGGCATGGKATEPTAGAVAARVTPTPSRAPTGRPVGAGVKPSAAARTPAARPPSTCKVRADSVEWQHRAGACRNGFAHGAGRADSVDGQRHYSGTFLDGAFHGEGSYDWGNGVRYVGRFERGARTGRGTLVYPDNRRYVGEFRDGLYDGTGMYTDADGSVYEGEFRAGRFNGRGRYRWANGDRYHGEFRDDLMEGEGEYLRANGEQYSGAFRDNRRHGRGTYLWPNGDRYVGMFADDEINGEGTYYHADGSRYAGTFRNGNKHGDGRLSSDAGEFRQRWEHGQKLAEEKLADGGPASGVDRPPGATAAAGP